MESKDDITGLGKYFKEKLPNSNCLNVSYENSIKSLKNISDFTSNRQWFYQTCNEFGWFPISDPNRNLFGKKFPWNIFSRMCREVFGEHLTDFMINTKILELNFYLATRLNLTNVYMTVGEFDPWRTFVQIPTLNVTVLPGKNFLKQSKFLLLIFNICFFNF